VRTIIVGDVHGCSAELRQLLQVVSFGSADRLVSVGDLVARGPDTPGVLELVRRCGGRAVRGNHEQRLLQVRDARARGELGPRLGASHTAVFDELSTADWTYLDAMPLWLDLPEHMLRVVHAGVVPGVAMSDQDPWALLHMRSLRDGKPSDKRGSGLWADHYAEEPHIVFGHNAIDGLQLHPHATGLDTGCVYGGALTALVLEEASSVPPVDSRSAQIVRIPAHRAYTKV
jgi:hypothetical protein